MPQELTIDTPNQEVVFDGFSDVIIDKTKQPETKPADVPADKPNDAIIDTETKPTDAPVEDGRNYLKEKLGYEDWDAAKNEIETLRTKSQTPAELKYEALEHGKIKELYAIIDKKERLDQLTQGEVTKENAAEIIKAAMKEKYKLNAEQINYKFNKQFAAPKKPVEDNFTTTEEFELAQNEWKEKVADLEMDLLIEANLSRPELEKIKAEIKLPEIAQPETADKPLTPQEQALVLESKKQFVQYAETEINKMDGFSVEYKDKDVNIKSTYALSPEEKASVLSKMQVLAEKNYNSNAVFAERWVNDDNTFNFSQIAKDIAILETYDKSNQKFVGDTVAKAKLQFIKEKHNIDLGTGGGNGELQLEDKERQKREEDALWA